MPVQRCYVEDIALNGGSHLISSAEGVQREVGVSLPMGVVATATIKGVKHIEFNLTLPSFVLLLNLSFKSRTFIIYHLS